MTLPNYPPLGSTFARERYLDSWRVILQPADVVVDSSAQLDYTSRLAVLAAPGVIEMGPADAVELLFAFNFDPAPDYESPIVSTRLLRIDPASATAYLSRRIGTCQLFGQDDAADSPTPEQTLSATMRAMIEYSGSGTWAWVKQLTTPTPQLVQLQSVSPRNTMVRTVGGSPWFGSGVIPPSILRGPVWGSEFFQLQLVSALLTSGSAFAVFGRRVIFEAIPPDGSRTGR